MEKKKSVGSLVGKGLSASQGLPGAKTAFSLSGSKVRKRREKASSGGTQSELWKVLEQQQMQQFEKLSHLNK